MPPCEWVMVKAQFAVLFGERFTRAMAARSSTRRTAHDIPDASTEAYSQLQQERYRPQVHTGRPAR